MLNDLYAGRHRLGQLQDALLRNARFMAQGYPPIRLVRRALLGDDSPAL